MIVSATAPVTLEHTFKTNFVNVYNIFLTQTVIKRKVRKLLGPNLLLNLILWCAYVTFMVFAGRRMPANAYVMVATYSFLILQKNNALRYSAIFA